VDTDAEDCAPLVLGSMRSAEEHAEAIIAMIQHLGLANRAIYQADLQRMHAEMCEALGWLPKSWIAVCRELAKLPGVKRGMVKIDGHRLTAYEIEPAAEAANVVPIERRREAS
jgi:hypothetical protein